MKDEYNLDGTGWARFSDDEKLRFRLGRVLDPRLANIGALWPYVAMSGWGDVKIPDSLQEIRRCTFVLVNPSTANAFKPDPTVQKCCKFATHWGCHVAEVVNLFAIRSTDPKVLYSPAKDLGACSMNDDETINACTGANLVIAAWGNHGHVDKRGEHIAKLLTAQGIPLWHLGLTDSGAPKHPLARGKAFIPITQPLQRYEVVL
jgi:hypothetical protein